MRREIAPGMTNKTSLQKPLSWQHYADTSRWKITGETVSLAGIPYGYDKVVWPEIRPR